MNSRNKNIVNIVRKIRVGTTNLTQQQLADKANIHVNTVRKVETENFTPKYPIRKKIADVLNFPITRLWYEQNKNK